MLASTGELWLLAGWARVLEVRCFYYHLREICSANDDRVRQVEGIFRQMRRGVFALQEQLKYCSALGPLLVSLRRTEKSRGGNTVGVQTIRRLEAAGVRTLADLAQLSLDDLIDLGIRRSLAGQLRSYVRRRLA
jgi:ATP-dependent DNA helicase